MNEVANRRRVLITDDFLPNLSHHEHALKMLPETPQPSNPLDVLKPGAFQWIPTKQNNREMEALTAEHQSLTRQADALYDRIETAYDPLLRLAHEDVKA